MLITKRIMIFPCYPVSIASPTPSSGIILAGELKLSSCERQGRSDARIHASGDPIQLLGLEARGIHSSVPCKVSDHQSADLKPAEINKRISILIILVFRSMNMAEDPKGFWKSAIIQVSDAGRDQLAPTMDSPEAAHPSFDAPKESDAKGSDAKKK